MSIEGFERKMRQIEYALEDMCNSPAYLCAVCDQVDCKKGFLPIDHHEAMRAEIGEE